MFLSLNLFVVVIFAVLYLLDWIISWPWGSQERCRPFSQNPAIQEAAKLLQKKRREPTWWPPGLVTLDNLVRRQIATFPALPCGDWVFWITGKYGECEKGRPVSCLLLFQENSRYYNHSPGQDKGSTTFFAAVRKKWKKQKLSIVPPKIVLREKRGITAYGLLSEGLHGISGLWFSVNFHNLYFSALFSSYQKSNSGFHLNYPLPSFLLSYFHLSQEASPTDTHEVNNNVTNK